MKIYCCGCARVIDAYLEENVEEIPKELAEMKMGDSCGWNNYEILRVPGGWIYTCHQETGMGGYCASSCFVPMPSAGNFERGHP